MSMTKLPVKYSRLRELHQQTTVDTAAKDEQIKRIKELQEFIAGQETNITEFDETLIKRLIEKFTVYEDHFTVKFKSGITIDIEV